MPNYIFFDTEHEVFNQINVFSSRSSSFDADENIVRLFHTAHERLLNTSTDHYTTRIFGDIDTHGDVYSFPVASEIDGLVVGDIGDSDLGSDIIIEDRSSNLQQINEWHRKFMTMQYPFFISIWRGWL
jgi:hypothetical protein